MTSKKRRPVPVGVLLMSMLFLATFSVTVPQSPASPGVAGVKRQQDIPLYLAEGTTREGFETWLCAVGTATECGYTLTVDYATQYGIKKSESYWVAPASRFTLYVNGVLGPGYDVSFRMTATVKDWPYPGDFGRYLVVERPMYFAYTGTGGHLPWYGGHVNVASRTPLSDRYYFAEGTTREGFDEWICVLNPNDAPAKLVFNYMIQGQGLLTREETVPPNHRATYYAANHVGPGKDVSLELVSDRPILAERPMYFAYKNIENGKICDGGHVITGARQADSDPHHFAFAPISFVPGMGWGNTWVCLQNPNPAVAPVDVGLSTTNGMVITRLHLPPQQRMTFLYKALMTGYVSKEPGAFWVRAADPTLPIMVERPVYMNFEFGGIDDGTVTAGQTGWYEPCVKAFVGNYKYAEGHTGDGFTTWMVLTWLRPDAPTRYMVDCYQPGQNSHIPIIVDGAEQGRQTWETTVWRVNNQFPSADLAFEAQSGFSERIMAFTYKGAWEGMHSSAGCWVLDPGI